MTTLGVKQQHRERHADRQPCIRGRTRILSASAASLAMRDLETREIAVGALLTPTDVSRLLLGLCRTLGDPVQTPVQTFAQHPESPVFTGDSRSGHAES